MPHAQWYPIVDPRGLVTPHHDGWSVDLWIIADDGQPLLPSRCKSAGQQLLIDDRLAVATNVANASGQLHSVADVVRTHDELKCRLAVEATSRCPAWLAVAIRPANPEGVSFIHEIAWQAPGKLTVNGEHTLELSQIPDRVCMSHYRRGDVFQDCEFCDAGQIRHVHHVQCDVGLATAAPLYRLEASS